MNIKVGVVENRVILLKLRFINMEGWQYYYDVKLWYLYFQCDDLVVLEVLIIVCFDSLKSFGRIYWII